MFGKLKEWIIGSVIVKKVIQKVAKHASTALAGLFTSLFFADKVKPILDALGISIDLAKLEMGLVVLLTGLLGGLWNYIDHRFLGKSVPPK